MRILICDDEQRFCAEVRRVVEEWKAAKGIESVFVDDYNSSEDLLEDIKNRPPYDLAFLDIQFPGEMNGLELAKLIRAGNEQISIVFISNYEEYAVDGYTVNALRFLYKPAKDDQIRECLDIAWHQYQLTMGSFVMVESKQQLIRLPYKSIRFVESRAHYLEIHLTDSEESSVIIRRKLPEFLPELASQMFVQCHRSYVVNLMYVQKIAKPAITLTDGTYVPVHMKYRENVFRAFRAFYQGGVG